MDLARWWCLRIDNHNRSKKHAENVSRLLLELGDDDEEEEEEKQENKDDDDDDDDDDGKLSDVDAENSAVADEFPDLSQSRYFSLFASVFFVINCYEVVKKLES